HHVGRHDLSFLSSAITPASAQSSFGTSWIMTCRFVGLAPACCTMASVIALHNARFCAGVRPVHICTVTTGISFLLRQDSLDPLADAAPLARSDGAGRAAPQTAPPDRLQPKPLRGVKIDAPRRRREVDNQRRLRQP